MEQMWYWLVASDDSPGYLFFPPLMGILVGGIAIALLFYWFYGTIKWRWVWLLALADMAVCMAVVMGGLSFVRLWLSVLIVVIMLYRLTVWVLKRWEAGSANRWKLWFKGLMVMLGGLVAVGAVSWAVFLAMALLIESCNTRMQVWHEFNAHLKDVCWRVNQAECPKNEAELIAFNPEKYNRMEKCAKMNYWYDSQTSLYGFMATRDGGETMVAHPLLPGGFEVYNRGGMEGYKPWPPEVPGEWGE